MVATRRKRKAPKVPTPPPQRRDYSLLENNTKRPRVTTRNMWLQQQQHQEQQQNAVRQDAPERTSASLSLTATTAAAAEDGEIQQRLQATALTRTHPAKDPNDEKTSAVAAEAVAAARRESTETTWKPAYARPCQRSPVEQPQDKVNHAAEYHGRPNDNQNNASLDSVMEEARVVSPVADNNNNSERPEDAEDTTMDNDDNDDGTTYHDWAELIDAIKEDGEDHNIMNKDNQISQTEESNSNRQKQSNNSRQISNKTSTSSKAVADGTMENNQNSSKDSNSSSKDDNQFSDADDAFSPTKAKTLSAEAFFLHKAFTGEEFQAIEGSLSQRVGLSMDLLERDGYQAYKDWRTKKEETSSSASARALELEQKRIQEALEDAKIHGLPRDYQQQLFEIACQRNTVVHLGTGQGKTLIALMCIRHFASKSKTVTVSGVQPSATAPNQPQQQQQPQKQILFLVPSVVLAEQQATVLRANLPYSVEVAAWNTTTTAKKRQKLRDANIMVATHGAMFDLLMHYGDMFAMEFFLLVVFDECHYCIGSHHYNAMMKRFYHTLPKEKRPHIVGLSATVLCRVKPKYTLEHLECMLNTFESNIDAKVVSHTKTATTIGAEEKDILYTIQTYGPSEQLPLVDDFEVSEKRKAECRQLVQLFDDLGPMALSIYCSILAREVSRNKYEGESRRKLWNLIRYLKTVAEFGDRLSRKCPRGGRSDKLLALEELLEYHVEENGGSDTTCIVFVERRITALALDAFFRWRLEQLENKNWYRAGSVRGINLPVEKTAGGSVSSKVSCSSTTLSDSWSSLAATTAVSAATGTMKLQPVLAKPKVSLFSRMDQFADADGDDDMDSSGERGTVHFEESTTISIRSDSIAVSANHGSGDIGPSPPTNFSQFMDAEDDQSETLTQDYLAHVRSGFDDNQCLDQRDKDPSTKDDPIEISVVKNSNLLANQFKDASNSNDKADAPEIDKENPEGCMDDVDCSEQDLAQLKDTIRCKSLVRHSTSIFKCLHKSHRRRCENDKEKEIQKPWLHQETKINEVIGALRRNEINVLIATSIVEEGIDIQACSCVCAFDNLRSTKGYVQMKGRARQKNAKFYVFKDNTTAHSAMLSLKDAQSVERRVHDFITSRCSLASIESPSHESRSSKPSREFDCLEMRAVEEKHYQARYGSVDLQSAKSLLNRYISSLPLDPICRSSKAALMAHLPSYSEHELCLPSHLPAKLRLIALPEEYRGLPSKKEKVKVLSMIAIVRLHQNGLLSDRLLPLTRVDLQEKMLAKVTEEPLNISIPRLRGFDETTNRKKFFVYPLIQKNSRIDKLHKILKGKGHSLAIISTEQLPAVPAMTVSHQGFGAVECSLGKIQEIECSEAKFQIIAQFTKLMFDSRWRKRSKNFFFRIKELTDQSTFIPITFVGALGEQGKIDYVQMANLNNEARRSESARIAAVRCSSDTEGLPEPRLWSPLYDKNCTYVVYGASGRNCRSKFETETEMEDVETFSDYLTKRRGYEVNDDCLLFDAQRLWMLPFSKSVAEDEDDTEFESKIPSSGAHSKRYKVSQELRSLYLPKDASMEVPMASPSFLLLATFLPQFLYHMQPHLVVAGFLRHCEKHMPRLGLNLSRLSPLKVAEALTAKSCSEEGSYEKLEWVGDAVLKMVQTDSLLFSKEFSRWIALLHEGSLSSLRSEMGKNVRLCLVCEQKKIHHFLLTQPLGRGPGGWTPSSLELYVPSTIGSDTGVGEAVKEAIPDKTRADVVESLLGLVYLSFNYEEASAVADELQVTLARDRNAIGGVSQGDHRTSVRTHMLAAATALTGHTGFKRHEWVQEAFTHPTAMHPEVPSYQRLEWTGDAVLCLAARQWIYSTFNRMEVGEMVAMEASLVSNETLAYLSIESGLLKNVDHCDMTLVKRIEHYEWCAREDKRGLWATDPPKVAADIVESVIGAVYMDSGFEDGIRAVNHVLAKLMPALEKMYAKDRNLDLMHPKKALQELGGSLLTVKVMREEDFAAKYPKISVWIGRQLRWGTASPDGTKFVGSVDCLGIRAVSVLDSSSEVAGNRACALAVAMLQKDPKLLSRVQEGRTLVESSATREEKDKAEEKKQAVSDLISADTGEKENPKMDIAEAATVADEDSNTEDGENVLTIDSLASEGREALLKSMINSVLEWL